MFWGEHNSTHNSQKDGRQYVDENGHIVRSEQRMQKRNNYDESLCESENGKEGRGQVESWPVIREG